MIDFHSHILPCVDDGSSSVEESVSLLEMLGAQGVERVFATPHFDASYDTPYKFLEEREKAYRSLVGSLAGKGVPNISLGAEVMYFPGICRMKELHDLKLEGTRLLLLEMPMEAWSDHTINELINLSCSGEITILLAHVERYLPYQRSDLLERLLDNGILMQTNVSFFINRKTRRKALKLLKNGYLHVLGSDCHNVEFRPPRIDEAVSIIKNKLGEDMLDRMNYFERYLLK